MKKFIITLSVAGFISLGFTVVGNNTGSISDSKSEQKVSAVKLNGSNHSDDKRLASWD